MNTATSTPKLTVEQESAREGYLKWANNYLIRKHEENPEQYPIDLVPKYMEHIRQQDFNKIFDENGLVRSAKGSWKEGTNDFLNKAEAFFESTIKHLREKGAHASGLPVLEEVAAHSPLPASMEKETLRNWVRKTEKSAAASQGKQFLSMASVGVGSVIMVDGVLNLVAPPMHKKVQQDGSITDERVSPVGKELAKIAIGAGTMGAGLLLTIERKGVPGPQAL